MPGVVITASRRLLAAFVFLATGWLVVWLAAFRVGHPQNPWVASKPDIFATTRCAVGSQYCISARPVWTIPLAAAIACLGISGAAVLYRGRPNWPLRPRTDDL